MWTDIFTAGGIIVLLIGAIKYNNGRITKMEDRMVLRESCKERHETVGHRLTDGEQKVTKIDEKIVEMTNILIRVDERVRNLAEKNGIK